MKKLVSLLLSFAVLFSVGFTAGCNQEQDPPSEPDYSGIKNVIIFIGDGMGFEHVKAGEIYMGRNTVFRGFNYATQSDTTNIDGTITDSAAGATALSCGVRTHNSYLGKNEYGENLLTIMDYAKEKGKAVGVVTSDLISGATPSGFSAHSNDRNDTYTIIKSQVTSDVDLFAGKYSEDYVKNQYKFEEQGYVFYDSLEEIDYNKKALIMGDVQPEMGANAEGEPYMMLDDMTTTAIDYLSRDQDGFTLMVEGAYIDKCSHGNDTAGMLKNLAAFDKAVAEAYKWARNRTDTVIIVTADHETGGLKVGAGANKQKLTSGNFSDISWESGNHTGARVPVFAFAPEGLDPMSVSTSGQSEYLNNKDIFLFMLSCVNGELTKAVPELY